MAEANQGVSSLPLPPMQFISLYTDENMQRGRVPRPPPPIKDSYNMFGIKFDSDDQIIRPLENQGLRRLYPQSYDHKRELKKLNYSILVNFLDLLDILIKSPDNPQKRGEKIMDLELLFIHMHHLINEFRPHQARETLRVMLEVQKRQRIETAEKFQKHLDKVSEIMNTSLSVISEAAGLDSKLMIKTEPMDVDDSAKQTLTEAAETEARDKMMCGIVDAMGT
ncbi:unnamed protein product [Owenia fusiformis]|uniref:Mediator of RNA polymerase II transcription subunit 7 n=1 Tax=Owenia fusiformis TaxID=6347 RepID=A0A8J1XIS4_OWEFU|nr:unnamed protein product [Owenia fusiformis]